MAFFLFGLAMLCLFGIVVGYSVSASVAGILSGILVALGVLAWYVMRRGLKTCGESNYISAAMGSAVVMEIFSCFAWGLGGVIASMWVGILIRISGIHINIAW